MENTTNTNSTTPNEIELPTDEVVKETTLARLEDLRLSMAWMAQQIGMSAEYVRRVLTGPAKLSRELKEKLWAFSQKLERIGMILQAA